VVPTDYGYCYGAVLDMGEEGTNYVRGYHWIMPWNQIRATGGNSGHIWVPIDDENTMVYNWNVVFEDTPKDTPRPASAPLPDTPDLAAWYRNARRPIGSGNEFVVDVDPETFRSVRNPDNRYLIDRQMQKTQTFTGITGLNTQDRAVQESMGPIADRTLERLGTTDRAIIHARRSLMQAVKKVQDGGDPPGLEPTYYRLRAHEGVLPKQTHWFEGFEDKLMRREKTAAR